ncbi:phosphinothricin acetyltransferase [Natronincola peptidivorans]|uniref:Phosphinothricin acetyltransferase n=1 Tax=Natronincola peptidivorans TaxID=426128 RepID=A0A1I0BWE1_9FIRM|nr:GNAT family N-acetyltransferase [Natronincola peptidivorans]SET11292.1 phosphinothricin acetyltransferase [Natronincola peptidivorans]
MLGYTFKTATEEDIPKLLEIYNHYVLNTTATFHVKALTQGEMRDIVLFEDPKYQTLVIMEGEDIIGYVILGQHKRREAYDTTGEVSVYLSPNLVGRGVGSMALREIEAFAKIKSFHVLTATICATNQKSIKLFERNGYVKCAHYKEVGKKFDKWLDSVVYQKILDA